MKRVSATRTIEQVPLSQLVDADRNARTHSEEQLRKLAASLTEYGWTNPVLIDAGRRIIAGHGRVAAARRLGLTHAPCIILTGLTPGQLRAYALADNRLALDAGWDTDLLALELGELKLDGVDLALTGFDASEIAALMSPDGFRFRDDSADEPPENRAPGTTDKNTAAGREIDLSGATRFRIVIDCRDEAQQRQLLERFGVEGIVCRALML